MISKEFGGTKRMMPEEGKLYVNVWPEIRQIEIYTGGGRSCVLYRDDAEDFVRWLVEAWTVERAGGNEGPKE